MYPVKIKKICFEKENKIVYREDEVELTLGKNDVLIRTFYSVISAGTELAKLTGLQKVQYPFIPGNRAVGEVIEVGSDVKNFAPGDYVFSHIPHVSHSKATRFCVKIPEKVELCHASTVGLGLVSMTALRVGQPELGDRAVVVGMGIVGNLCAQLLKNAGVDVIAIDMIDERLQKARQCGISYTVNPQKQDVQSRVMEITDGRGVEFVIEATGNPRAIDTAYSVTARQGKIILLGSPRGEHKTDVVPLLNSIHLWREHGSVELEGAHEWRYPLYPDGYTKHSMQRNAEVFFRMMADGRLNIRELITHLLKPSQAAEAFEGLLNHKDEYLGVVFDWVT
jgi:2-desacetyl-2-hydroxyethyl bacteriochlorophyllide A dehydrogenase